MSQVSISTLALRVKSRNGGNLQGFAPEASSGKRWEGDTNPNGSLIATILINHEEGTYQVTNVLAYQNYRGAINSTFEGMALNKLVMITDEDSVYKADKQEIPAPVSTKKLEEMEAKRKAVLASLGDMITTSKELANKALTERHKVILWVPCVRVTLKHAYELEWDTEGFKPKDIIPSLDRVNVFRVNGVQPTHVLAIGFAPKMRKSKRTFKGIVKAEYTLSQWKALHPTEKFTVGNNPLVEHDLYKLPGQEVALKTSKEYVRENNTTIQDCLDKDTQELLVSMGKLPQQKEKQLSPEEAEFAAHTPKMLAPCEFIKDGSMIYLSHTQGINLFGTSPEKAIKRLGTVAGLDEHEMLTNFQIKYDLTENVDGLLGYMHPKMFMEYVRATCSKDIVDYYNRLYKKGQLNCRQFGARLNADGSLVKGNMELSSKVAEGTIVVLGHSGFCPEIRLEGRNWLHMRVGIKSSRAAVSRSLSCFIRGVFGCMTSASQASRKHVEDHMSPENLHLLVEHLGDAEAEVSTLYQELLAKGHKGMWTNTIRGLLLNRVFNSRKMEVQKNLDDGKFPIDGSMAGAISVITKWTDLGEIDSDWVKDELEKFEEGAYGRIYTSVCLNGTFFYSREAVGYMHVSLGTCDFDDWFGFIPASLVASLELVACKEESQLAKIFGAKTKRTTQYLGVFFRWPQGFREARQSKVWIIGGNERKLYPNVAPWVKPWEPGMEGIKPIVDCTDKLFPNPEDVVRKSIALKEVMTYEKIASHKPVNLIGRFYNALVVVLSSLIVAHDGDDDAIAKAMEECKELILLYSTSDIVDLEKMGVDSASYAAINSILEEIKALVYKPAEFLARHAGDHDTSEDDTWSQAWNQEIISWNEILENIQDEVFSIGEAYRVAHGITDSTTRSAVRTTSTASWVLTTPSTEAGKIVAGSKITSEKGHEYARFLLKKWGQLWIQLMALEKEIKESIDPSMDVSMQEQQLRTLSANMRGVVFKEIQQSLDQISLMPEETQVAIGFGVISEFMSRVGKVGKGDDGEYISKGGAGLMASPMGFALLAKGLKPISELLFNQDDSLYTRVNEGTLTFTARSSSPAKVETLLDSSAALLMKKNNVIVDSYSSKDEDGKSMMRYILVLGVSK